MDALIRARHPQMLLELLAERHPPAHARVMQALTCAPQLKKAMAVDWVPVEMDVEVIERVSDELLAAPMAALVAERQRKEMGSALFKSFVATALKLFGVTPATIIRHLGRGWGHMFSDCGDVEVVKLEPRAGVVAIRGLPQCCLRCEPWIDAMAPGMQALFELVKTPVEIEVSRHAAHVELHYRW